MRQIEVTRPSPARPLVRAVVLAVALLVAGTPGVSAGDEATQPPEPTTIRPADCDATTTDDGNPRWRCPIEPTPGWARLDFELAEGAVVSLLHGGFDDDPAFQATQAWVDLHRDDDWAFLGATHATRGHSDYERTVVRVGGDALYEEERESEASGTDSRGTFNRGHGTFFEAGSHSLLLIYAWHHTAGPEYTYLDLLGHEAVTGWEVTNHPGMAWLYDDRDFDVNVAQMRRDGAAPVIDGDIRGYNVTVDATLTHTFEHQATGMFNVRGEQTNGAAGLIGFDSEQRSCQSFPRTFAFPFNASLHIPASPPGEYEFHVELKAERHAYPHSVLLLADVDIPVQPWPPRSFADDTVNDVAMGAVFCDGT